MVRATALHATLAEDLNQDARDDAASVCRSDRNVLCEEEDLAGRVHEVTGGEGVPVVYDGVGAATFEGSLAR